MYVPGLFHLLISLKTEKGNTALRNNINVNFRNFYQHVNVNELYIYMH